MWEIYAKRCLSGMWRKNFHANPTEILSRGSIREISKDAKEAERFLDKEV